MKKDAVDLHPKIVLLDGMGFETDVLIIGFKTPSPDPGSGFPMCFHHQ
jgi:hypothetical protein